MTSLRWSSAIASQVATRGNVPAGVMGWNVLPDVDNAEEFVVMGNVCQTMTMMNIRNNVQNHV